MQHHTLEVQGTCDVPFQPGGRCARRCAGIGEAHALVRSEALLAGRLRALAHSLSDANLSGTPKCMLYPC